MYQEKIHNFRQSIPSCGFYMQDASLSSTYVNPVGLIKFYQTCENQTWSNLIFADSLQVVETICIKLVDKKY